MKKDIETRLVKKVAKFTTVCNNCNNKIFPDNVYHIEEGVCEHLHSLIARRFCSDCYAKFGGPKLLSGKDR